MNNSVLLKPINGLGDKFINLIGSAVYCYYKKYDLRVLLNEGIYYYDFGTHNYYDLSLFNFNDICVYNITNEIDPICLENAFLFYNPDTIVSITPHSIYTKLIHEGHDVSFKDVSDMFIKIAKNIQPSEIISRYIPAGIENAYGIHLRKTDKIKPNPDIRHEMSPDENDILINELKNTIEHMIENEENISFYITSEDNQHKQEFTDFVHNIGKNKNKLVKVFTIEENIPENIRSVKNFDTILDLFCLSKCKSIIQGVKYSAFSVVASLIGNKKIINLSKFLTTNNLCIIYLWNSVISINDNINFDESEYVNLINKYKELGVFYGDIYLDKI